MSDHEPTKWEIFCVVFKETTPFAVKIQPDATVDALKDAIKIKKQPEFDGFAADRLTLFKIDVPAANRDEKLAAFATKLPPTQMDPLHGLNMYFSDTPPGQTVHILVQTPNTLPQTGLKRGLTEEGSDVLTPLAKKPRLHKQDITDQLVQKWSRPMPAQALNLHNLRICLQQPLAEDEKIPISQDSFDNLTRYSSKALFHELALSAEEAKTLFRVSEDESARPAERLFVPAIERPPPPSGTEDTFHGTMEDNIGWILRTLLPEGVSIRNSNRDSSTALKQPDYGFLMKGHCVVRGEEEGTDSRRDSARKLVEKLYKWTYQPLPFILGYHAIATDVLFVAITPPPSRPERLFNHDLRFKKERVANLVHLIRLSGVVACMGQELQCRNAPEFFEFELEGGLVRMNIGAVVRKQFRHPDAVNRVSKLVEIYDLLKAKQVPNVDTLVQANTAATPPYVQLSPVGEDVLPRFGSESLDSVVCVLEALKVMHSGPNPVYHRDIRDPNIIKRCDGTGWFLIDWSDATTIPTHAAMHLKPSEHSPAVRQDGHGAEVDIWGVGRYLEDLASRRYCGIAKPDEVKQMARRWIEDPATSAEAALHEINTNRDLFIASAAQSS